MPKVNLHPPVNLRTKDKTDRKMYGLETAEENNSELDAFRKVYYFLHQKFMRQEIESKTRREQFSWDVCCIFKIGTDSQITLPRTQLAKALPKLKKKEKKPKKKKDSLQDEKYGQKKKRDSSIFGFFGDDDEDEEEEVYSETESVDRRRNISRYNTEDEDDSHSDTSRVVRRRIRLKKKEYDSDENSDASSRRPTRKNKFKKVEEDEDEQEDEEDDEEDDEEFKKPEIKKPEDEGIGDMVELSEAELYTRTTAQLIRSIQAV